MLNMASKTLPIDTIFEELETSRFTDTSENVVHHFKFVILALERLSLSILLRSAYVGPNSDNGIDIEWGHRGIYLSINPSKDSVLSELFLIGNNDILFFEKEEIDKLVSEIQQYVDDNVSKYR